MSLIIQKQFSGACQASFQNETAKEPEFRFSCLVSYSPPFQLTADAQFPATDELSTDYCPSIFQTRMTPSKISKTPQVAETNANEAEPQAPPRLVAQNRVPSLPLQLYPFNNYKTLVMSSGTHLTFLSFFFLFPGGTHTRIPHRQTLESAPRPACPIQYHEFDDSTDTIALDPELALIAKTYAESQQSQVSSSADLYPRSQSETQDDINEEESVTLTVRWIPHPLNEAGKKQVWGYMIQRVRFFHDHDHDDCIYLSYPSI